MKLLKTIIITSASLLGGCGTMPQGGAWFNPLPESMYNWKKSERKPMPYVLVTKLQGELEAICARYGAWSAYACAVYHYDGVCRIYTSEANLFKWPQLLGHEIKHCKGWDHD